MDVYMQHLRRSPSVTNASKRLLLRIWLMLELTI
jgi:hypothetical protein